ncbi:hydantoinase B/oxoprolinase family protein [Streptomyces sp. NBC_01476]|uniref:hydantoinase B/oxoprolinase family protein n=1 Tax=Streptomyces sp. NBC_01476 TaxID=2903881 RepID=UPI002E37CA9B|nr:hydantoinase B/oxoprolinase family protein [Streptomyces sp. NBC_01476]
MSTDPITFQVLRARLSGVVQEMQFALFRTGFSTIIRESQDASCALLDPAGKVVAQHVVLPLHIGAFPACAAAVLAEYGEGLRPGDAYLINHTYEGASPHAPDFFIICPVFTDGELLGFAASMAHKGDIGGPVPGSCSARATEIYNEGLHLPAVRYQRGYRTVRELERIVAANSRTPEVVVGDMRGQLGAVRLGERRLREIAAKHGLAGLREYFGELLHISQARVRAAFAGWPDGVATAERFVDDDGIDLERSFRIAVTVRKSGDRLAFDFTGSDDQTAGPANIRPPLLRAACAYVVISLLGTDTYVNSGLLDSLELITRPGSVVDPRFPAAVNTYNPTVHAVVDAVFDAMSRLVPGRGRADGCASRSFVMSGGHVPGTRAYVQYELFGGGTGARPDHDGVSGSSVNHTNGKIAPIEIVESEYATRVVRCELIPDSAGAGRQRGGLGIRREYEVLEPARFSLRSTRHKIAPLGVNGGGDGRIGRLTVNPGTDRERVLPSRYADLPLAPGDRFVLETPGGGGFGSPLERDPLLVLADVRAGYVSPEGAAADYGVALRPGTAPGGRPELDEEATARLRAASRARADGGAAGAAGRTEVTA